MSSNKEEQKLKKRKKLSSTKDQKSKKRKESSSLSGFRPLQDNFFPLGERASVWKLIPKLKEIFSPLQIPYNTAERWNYCCFQDLQWMIAHALVRNAESDLWLQQQVSGLNLVSLCQANERFLSAEDFRWLASFVNETDKEALLNINRKGAARDHINEVFDWIRRLQLTILPSQHLPPYRIFDRLKACIDDREERLLAAHIASNQQTVPASSSSISGPSSAPALPTYSSSSSILPLGFSSAPQTPAEVTFAQGMKFYQAQQDLQASAFFRRLIVEYPLAHLLLAIIYKNSENHYLRNSDLATVHTTKWQGNYLKFFNVSHLSEVTKPAHLVYIGLMLEFGICLSPNDKAAFEYFEKAARAGDRDGQFFLARHFLSKDGSQQDYKRAFEYYKELAEQGDVSAQNEMGVCYEHGYGLPADRKQALVHYTEAASKGHAYAQYNLALLLKSNSADPTEVFTWFSKAAVQGIPEAHYELGLCYLLGDGTDSHYKQAFACFSWAVAQKKAWGCYYLGTCYELEIGVEQNLAQAQIWYEKAAEQGITMAVESLKSLAPQLSSSGSSLSSSVSSSSSSLSAQEDQIKITFAQGWKYLECRQFFQAMPFLEEAARHNYLPAHLALIILYENDKRFLTDARKKECLDRCGEQAFAFFNLKDLFDSTEILKEVTKPDHLLYLGLMYQYGIVFKRDPKLAVNCFDKAAQAGNTDARCQLALCYYSKIVVKGDEHEQQAFAHFKKAAEQGHTVAKAVLGKMYDDGRCNEIDSEQQAFKWLTEAAEEGMAVAQFDLTKLYWIGKGTQPNAKQAFEWLIKSAIQGDFLAQKHIGKCYGNGIGTEPDRHQAFACFSLALARFDKASYDVGICYERGIGVEVNLEQAKRWLTLAAKKVPEAEAALARINQLLGSSQVSFSSGTFSSSSSSSSSSSLPSLPSLPSWPVLGSSFNGYPPFPSLFSSSFVPSSSSSMSSSSTFSASSSSFSSPFSMGSFSVPFSSSFMSSSSIPIASSMPVDEEEKKSKKRKKPSQSSGSGLSSISEQMTGSELSSKMRAIFFNVNISSSMVRRESYEGRFEKLQRLIGLALERHAKKDLELKTYINGLDLASFHQINHRPLSAEDFQWLAINYIDETDKVALEKLIAELGRRGPRERLIDEVFDWVQQLRLAVSPGGSAPIGIFDRLRESFDAEERRRIQPPGSSSVTPPGMQPPLRELKSKLQEIFSPVDIHCFKAAAKWYALRYQNLQWMIANALARKAESSLWLQQQVNGLNLVSFRQANERFLSVEDFRWLASFVNETDKEALLVMDRIRSVRRPRGHIKEVFNWVQQLQLTILPNQPPPAGIFDRIKASIDALGEELDSSSSSLTTSSNQLTGPTSSSALPMHSSSSSISGAFPSLSFSSSSSSSLPSLPSLPLLGSSFSSYPSFSSLFPSSFAPSSSSSMSSSNTFSASSSSFSSPFSMGSFSAPFSSSFMSSSSIPIASSMPVDQKKKEKQSKKRKKPSQSSGSGLSSISEQMSGSELSSKMREIFFTVDIDLPRREEKRLYTNRFEKLLWLIGLALERHAKSNPMLKMQINGLDFAWCWGDLHRPLLVKDFQWLAINYIDETDKLALAGKMTHGTAKPIIDQVFNWVKQLRSVVPPGWPAPDGIFDRLRECFAAVERRRAHHNSLMPLSGSSSSSSTSGPSSAPALSMHSSSSSIFGAFPSLSFSSSSSSNLLPTFLPTYSTPSSFSGSFASSFSSSSMNSFGTPFKINSSFPSFSPMSSFSKPVVSSSSSSSMSSLPTQQVTTEKKSADKKLTKWEYARLDNYDKLPPRNPDSGPEEKLDPDASLEEKEEFIRKLNPHVSYEYAEAMLRRGVFIRMFSASGDKPGSYSASFDNEIAMLKDTSRNRDFRLKIVKDANRNKIFDPNLRIWIPRPVDEKNNPRGRDKPGVEVTKKASVAYCSSQFANKHFDKGDYLVGIMYDPRYVKSNESYNFEENALTFNGPWLDRGQGEAAPQIPIQDSSGQIIGYKEIPQGYSIPEIHRRQEEKDLLNQQQEAKNPGQGQIFLGTSESLIKRRKEAMVGIRIWKWSRQARLMAFDKQFKVRKELGVHLPRVYWSGERFNVQEVTDKDIVLDIHALLKERKERKERSSPEFQALMDYCLDGHFEPGTALANLLLTEIDQKIDAPDKFKLLRALLSLGSGATTKQEVGALIKKVGFENIATAEWQYILYCLTKTGRLSSFINEPLAEFISHLMENSDTQKMVLDTILNQPDIRAVSEQLLALRKISVPLTPESQSLILDFCVKNQEWQTLAQIVSCRPTSIEMWKQPDTGSNVYHILANKTCTIEIDLFGFTLLALKNGAGQTPIDIAIAANNRHFLGKALVALEESFNASYKKELIAQIQEHLQKTAPPASLPRSPSAFFALKDDKEDKEKPASQKHASFSKFMQEVGSKRDIIVVDDEDKDYPLFQPPPLGPKVKEEPSI